MSHIVLQEFTQILNNKELLNKIENFNKKTLVKKINLQDTLQQHTKVFILNTII